MLNDQREGLGAHLVLERGKLGQRLGWQQVSAGAEELPQLDEQTAHLDRRHAEVAQHTLERLDIGTRLVIATLARAHHPQTLAIHHNQRAK